MEHRTSFPIKKGPTPFFHIVSIFTNRLTHAKLGVNLALRVKTEFVILVDGVEAKSFILEKSHDFFFVIDSNGLSRGLSRQAWHRHDFTTYYDDESGPRR